MEDLKAFFCSSKFPWAREKNFFEIYRQLGHASSKRFASHALDGLRKSTNFHSV